MNGGRKRGRKRGCSLGKPLHHWWEISGTLHPAIGKYQLSSKYTLFILNLLNGMRKVVEKVKQSHLSRHCAEVLLGTAFAIKAHCWGPYLWICVSSSWKINAKRKSSEKEIFREEQNDSEQLKSLCKFSKIFSGDKRFLYIWLSVQDWLEIFAKCWICKILKQLHKLLWPSQGFVHF